MNQNRKRVSYAEKDNPDSWVETTIVGGIVLGAVGVGVTLLGAPCVALAVGAGAGAAAGATASAAATAAGATAIAAAAAGTAATTAVATAAAAATAGVAAAAVGASIGSSVSKVREIDRIREVEKELKSQIICSGEEKIKIYTDPDK